MTSQGVKLNKVSSGVHVNETTVSSSRILNKSYSKLNSGSKKSTTVEEFSHGTTGHEHYVGTEKIPDIDVKVSKKRVTYERRNKKKISGKKIALIVFLIIFFGPSILEIIGDLLSSFISGIIDMFIYL